MNKWNKNEYEVSNSSSESSSSSSSISSSSRSLSTPAPMTMRIGCVSDKLVHKTTSMCSHGTSATVDSYGSCKALNNCSDTASKEMSKAKKSGGHDVQSLERQWTLTDLTVMGVGVTIGSGIFVLCGLIAREYAGPATVISWAISGMAACLSGCCYAELASRLPVAGSAYMYVSCSMGELPAVIAAACLSVEFLASSAAVARSWGDKTVNYMMVELNYGAENGDGHHWIIHELLDPNSTSNAYNINPFAFIIASMSTILLLMGVKESKTVTKVFTVTKVCLVLFMIGVGLTLLNVNNLHPFMPQIQESDEPADDAIAHHHASPYAGVLRGATSSFFGYLGYDCVCCMSGEAINSRRDLPRAILGTLSTVTMLYILAAFALTGMQPYYEISTISGFPEAFRYNGVNWAMHVSAAGEVLTLPIVVLISLSAQPRLQYALANDGLLPRCFAEIDSTGNLFKGTLVAGLLMIAIATVVPFTHLNDFISSAVLIAFSLTNSSLVLLRLQSPSQLDYHAQSDDSSSSSFLLERLLLAFNFSSLVSGVFLSHCIYHPLGKLIAVISTFTSIFLCFFMHRWCPKQKQFAGNNQKVQQISEHSAADNHGNLQDQEIQDEYFATPWVPFIPCLGIFVNWYLLSQLELFGICLLLSLLGITVLCYSFHKSKQQRPKQHGYELP